MAININKNEDEFKYYYSSEGNQYGPFNFNQLLAKIDRDTLVWRDGIDWTNAGNLEELKNSFPMNTAVVNGNQKDLNSKSTVYSDTHKPSGMFSSAFSFNGRIRRTEYIISFIVYFIGYAIIMATSKDSPIFGMAFIPLIWFLWAQGAKRCHDRENSGWYQIIPFYALWMLFAEGNSAPNEYGNSPK